MLLTQGKRVKFLATQRMTAACAADGVAASAARVAGSHMVKFHDVPMGATDACFVVCSWPACVAKLGVALLAVVLSFAAHHEEWGVRMIHTDLREAMVMDAASLHVHVLHFVWHLAAHLGGSCVSCACAAACSSLLQCDRVQGE